jgi:hypothetical protein
MSIDIPRADTETLDWLLASDPAIRWQVMRDLVTAPDDAVAAERSRVATEGMGGRLLGRQKPDGSWDNGAPETEWTASPEGSAFVSLLWLREAGLDPQSEGARRAVGLVRDKVTWHWWDDHPFFVGEVEPCINGRVVALGAYFGEDVSALVERLLGEQMADGGWNCEQENGSVRGSFGTTINVLEGLLEFERATGGDADVTTARERGGEYLLQRRLLRRLSDGEVMDSSFTDFWFPPAWHYDVLRALDFLRHLGPPDDRMSEAFDVVKRKRGDDGRWRIDEAPASELVPEFDERAGEPSRWLTMRALRALGCWMPPGKAGNQGAAAAP